MFKKIYIFILLFFLIFTYSESAYSLRVPIGNSERIKIEMALTYSRDANPSEVDIEAWNRMLNSLDPYLEEKIKFLIPFMASSKSPSKVIKKAHEEMFNLIEKEFINIKSRDAKIDMLTRVLEYAQKNKNEYKVICNFLGKIGGRGIINTDDSPRKIAQDIIDNISLDTIYVNLTRGLSLTEIKMIAKFGYFINTANRSILADASSAKAYQRGTAREGRIENREIVLYFRVPRWLVEFSTPPYGDMGFVHFGDKSEIVSDEYKKVVKKMLIDAEDYYSNHIEEFRQRKAAFIAEYKREHKTAVPRRFFNKFMQSKENVRVMDASDAVNNLKQLLSRIEKWDNGELEAGTLDAGYVDWKKSLDANVDIFREEQERFIEEVLPVFLEAANRFDSIGLSETTVDLAEHLAKPEDSLKGRVVSSSEILASL